MKIVALNGSPKGNQSNTNTMIQALLKGFATPEHSVECIQLADKNIRYCKGCYSCWSKTPGVCIHNDDMHQIIAEMRDVDYLIFGSPLFLNNVSGTLKVFFDRLTAAGGDPTNKTESTNKKAPKYIMVSNCGFAYRSQFDIISLWINRVANMTKAKVVAEFYTTDGKALSAPTKEQERSRTNYLGYLKECGHDLMLKNELNEERKKLLTRSILEF
jgi:multimeric flavodoxin WrbA